MEPLDLNEKADIVISQKDAKCNILIEGHRGGKFDYDNTLSAFKQAVEKNLYGIEFDLWLTQDKVPIVLHGEDDGKVGYNSEEHGIKKESLVTELTLKQIKNIVLPNGELIPTFEELLDVCGNKIRLNIELKDRNLEICQIVLNLLAERGITNKMAWFTSFRHDVLKEINRLDPSFEVGYLYEKDDVMDPDYYPFHGNSCNIAYSLLTQEIVEKCHKNGVKVSVYFTKDFPEEPSFYQNIIDCGVDMVISDKPIELANYIESISVSS